MAMATTSAPLTPSGLAVTLPLEGSVVAVVLALALAAARLGRGPRSSGLAGSLLSGLLGGSGQSGLPRRFLLLELGDLRLFALERLLLLLELSEHLLLGRLRLGKTGLLQFEFRLQLPLRSATSVL